MAFHPVSAGAALNVVATTSSMGMLARAVGGEAVKITVLSPPDRDAHYLLARPSMMVALRRADLLVAVGADLEVAWLPEALRGASRPEDLPGQSGYFEGAAQIDLIETGQAADRARGDVHPAGTPTTTWIPSAWPGWRWPSPSVSGPSNAGEALASRPKRRPLPARSPNACLPGRGRRQERPGCADTTKT